MPPMTCRRPGPARASAHADERGAAMFIVLMVIMILSGIGMFAVRSTRFEVQTAGYSRQQMVTSDLTSMGAYAAMTELAAKADIYHDRLIVRHETCMATQGLTVGGLPIECLTLDMTDFEYATGFKSSSEKLFVLAAPATGTPGSYGLEPITGAFRVEITDPIDTTIPTPGYTEMDTLFLGVTVTVMGTIFQNPELDGIWHTAEQPSATFVTGRARVVAGPIIKRR